MDFIFLIYNLQIKFHYICIMKTLVIHPKDLTTEFLSIIYKDKDWTIIDDPYFSKSKLKKSIKDHDRIIMLGHGTSKGMGIIKEGFFKYIVDSTLVYLLRQKKCIFIWCEADQFVKKYKLSGFYTGMIISGIDESYFWGIDISYDNLVKSNKLFAESLQKSIDATDILTEMKKYYKGGTSIIDFNSKNLYFK